MTTSQLVDTAEGIAKIKNLIREHAEPHRQEIFSHYMRMIVKQWHQEGIEEILCLINRVYQSPLKRKEYTDYLFDAMKAKEFLGE